LALSTEHTRVVIFTDAEELPAAMASATSAVIPPYEWRNIEANADKRFHIRPLERRLFNHASANRFLKTLEEPPPRTLFFFIAETEEQILETIVSRCQVVPCQTGFAEDAGLAVPEACQAFLEEWIGTLSRKGDVYASASEFEAFFVDGQGLTRVQALDLLQLFLRARFLPEIGAAVSGFMTYRAVQEAIESARRMLEAKVNEGQSLLNLFLALAERLPALRA
jgi:hypothetical protein